MFIKKGFIHQIASESMYINEILCCVSTHVKIVVFLNEINLTPKRMNAEITILFSYGCFVYRTTGYIFSSLWLSYLEINNIPVCKSHLPDEIWISVSYWNRKCRWPFSSFRKNGSQPSTGLWAQFSIRS